MEVEQTDRDVEHVLFRQEIRFEIRPRKYLAAERVRLTVLI